MDRHTCRISRGQEGFTLIELLVVIVIIGILAAIAIPTFLGQRHKAQDAVAKSLVRNAMIAIESAYVDTRAFDEIDMTGDPNALEAAEPSIAFAELANAATAATAEAENNAVNVDLTGPETYEVGTLSASGEVFGVEVDKGAGGGTVYHGSGWESDGGSPNN